tara:strand:- start:2288 stop:2536 length:249 start_codon:yes stop_codon:yes gene_type:complete
MGRKVSRKLQRRCYVCAKNFRSVERLYDEHETKTFHFFKYGGFCTLACAAEYGIRSLDAGHCFDHDGNLLTPDALKNLNQKS